MVGSIGTHPTVQRTYTVTVILWEYVYCMHASLIVVVVVVLVVKPLDQTEPVQVTYSPLQAMTECMYGEPLTTVTDAATSQGSCSGKCCTCVCICINMQPCTCVYCVRVYMCVCVCRSRVWCVYTNRITRNSEGVS